MRRVPKSILLYKTQFFFPVHKKMILKCENAVDYLQLSRTGMWNTGHSSGKSTYVRRQHLVPLPWLDKDACVFRASHYLTANATMTSLKWRDGICVLVSGSILSLVNVLLATVQHFNFKCLVFASLNPHCGVVRQDKRREEKREKEKD